MKLIIWSQQCMKSVNTYEPMYKTETYRHREQAYVCKGRERRKWDGWGVWGWQMQTIPFRMDKQGGSPVQRKELYPVS